MASGYSVQGDAPGKQSAGGIAGLFGKKVSKAQGPNTAAYDVERQRAHQTADRYGQLAYDYQQQGPTINNQFQGQSRDAIGGNIGAQQNLAGMLMNNNGEASKAQFQGHLDQSIAAQMAAANSTPGGAVAQSGAIRNAAAQGAMTRAQGSAEAARLGALEREAALGQAAGVYGNIGNQLQGQYGLEQNSAIAQGQLDSQNQAQQNQMRLGYGVLGNQSQAQGLAALQGYTSGNMTAQGLSAGLKAQDTADTNQMIGLGAGVAGTALGGPPKAAHGGAIGRAPNSIAAIYAPSGGEARQHTANLAEALAGIEVLKARLQARADGGPVGATAQWERSFGSADQARTDVQNSDNRAEAAKIRSHFETPAQPSLAGSAVRQGLAGLASFGSTSAPDWSEYMHPRARAFGGIMDPYGDSSGVVDIGSGGGGISNVDILRASSGRTGNAMMPVGGGGVVGGSRTPGGRY